MVDYANETRLVRRARLLAEEWHAGFNDKSGHPYVEHLAAVSYRAWTYAPSHLRESCAAAGWLHDVLEDTDVPWRLVTAAVPPMVGAAVMALSHLPGEPWVDYMRRIAEERQVAPFVKWADIGHNANPDRLALVAVAQPDVYERMVANLPRRVEDFRQAMWRASIIGPWAAAGAGERLLRGAA